MSTTPDPVAEGISLSKQLNPIYLQNFSTALNAVAPGAAGQVSSIISSELAGQLSPATVKQMAQQSAELNLSQGRFGEAAENRTAEDLGTTSEALQAKGLTDAKAMMPALPDVATLVQNQMTYDTTQQAMAIQQSQFAQTLSEKQSEFAQQTALTKLGMTIQQSQFTASQAQQQGQFNANMNWTQTLSSMNQNFEKWAIGQQQQSAQNIMNQKSSDLATLLAAQGSGGAGAGTLTSSTSDGTTSATASETGSNDNIVNMLSSDPNYGGYAGIPDMSAYGF